MDFDSPDVEKDFPGLYASEINKKSQSRDSDYSDEEKTSRKDLLGKKREKRESKKDKGYAALEGESSNEDDETKSPGKGKKVKSTFKLGKEKREKHNKKDREPKDKKEDKEKEKVCKKESKEVKKEIKEVKKETKEVKKETKEVKKDTKDVEKRKDKKKKKDNKLLKLKDKKKSIDQDIAGEEEKPIFGVPLNIAIERSKSHDGIDIPVIVRDCIDYIEEHGLACESIYKISGLKSKVRHLKAQYNKREKVYLYEHEPHIVASLLKQFLRDLPEPILTAELAPKFEEAAALKNEKKRLEALYVLISELPHPNRLLLSWIFVHMTHVVHLEKRNKMNIQNVSIALSPALHISHQLLQALFAYSDTLFRGVEIKKYVPPIELDSSRLSLELPDSPSAIEDELAKQENVLNNLHAELNTGVRDQEKEEKLWEIQRVVTQLKRKLRFLKQVQEASNPNVSEVQTIDKRLKGNFQANIKQLSTTDDTVFSMPFQEKAVDNDVKGVSSKKRKMEPNLKSPDVTAANKNNSKKLHSPSQVKQTIDFMNGVSEGPNLNKEESCSYMADKSAQDEKVDPEFDPDFPDRYSPILTLPEFHPDTIVAELSHEIDVMYSLMKEEKMLQIQAEELVFLGDELKRKVFSEKMEIERLKSEINEYEQLNKCVDKYKRYSFDSTEKSSSETDKESTDTDEEKQVYTLLEQLIKENKMLESKNTELTKVVQKEREISLNVKVQLKMLQQADMKPDANNRP